MFSGFLWGQSALIPQDNSFESWYSYYSSFPISAEEDDDSEAAQFMKWAYFWKNRLANDDLTSGSQLANKNMAMFLDDFDLCYGTIDDNINWTELGPFNSQGSTGGIQNQGQIKALSVNPDDEMDIVVGAVNGGIWRSTNGGNTWSNKTDDSGFTVVGIRKLVRHPENSQILYAATGGEFGVWQDNRSYGVGVLKSTDGGDNWEKTGFHVTFGMSSMVGTMAIDPSSTIENTIIYIGSGFVLFKYQGNADGMGPWKPLHGANNWIAEVETEDVFNTAVSNTVWFADFDGNLFRINAGTETVVNLTIPDPEEILCSNGDIIPNDFERKDIAIEIDKNQPQNEVILLVKYRQAANSCINLFNRFLFRTLNSGQSWLPLVQVPHTYPFNGVIEVNDLNSQIMYLERQSPRRPYKTVNGGVTPWQSMQNNQLHDDTRVMTFFSGDASGQNDVIYLGSDGGVAKTTNGQDWVDITGEGMACTNNFGLAVTDAKKDFIVAGAQDGSINFYNQGQWFETGPSGDNADCIIDWEDPSRIYQCNQGALHVGIATANSISAGSIYSYDDYRYLILLQNPVKSNEIFIAERRLLLYDNSVGGAPAVIFAPLGGEISSMAMSESNPNILYFAVRLGDLGQQGIWKATKNGGSWTTTFINSLDNAGFVTDLCISPDDENNVWASIGRFDADRKVFHSTDGGISWTSENGCLPNIPMTAIAYQKGSNDGIYLGSDFGVFYKNADMEDWIYYGNGGPRTMVADMEINNCSNELIVATQGRGMWKVPMLQINSEKIVTNLEEDVIWNKPTTITQDVRITEGTTLRIQGARLNIAEGKRIIVEKGARLYVDNSTLTNVCGGQWGGIQVLGDPNATQIFVASFNQGYVSIANHSLIENSVFGVMVQNDTPPQSGGGGILIASNSAFKNNTTAVNFARYQNFNPLTQQSTGNLSSFRNCQFLIDEDFVGNYHSIVRQVKLTDVQGIEFYGCKFENAHPDRAFINDGKIGIESRDSEFIVTSYCPQNLNIPLPCPSDNELSSEFAGFEKGIYAHNVKSINTFRVTHTNFIGNHVGLVAEGVNNPYIVKNNFYVGNELPSNANYYRGLQLDECTGYQVEGNYFTQAEGLTANGQLFRIGSVIIKSGSEPNEIYRNIYQNLGFANLANGNNQGLDENIGLEYLCNTNIEGNFFDFAVNTAGSIAVSQGSVQQSAGNSFTPNPLPNIPTHFSNAGSNLSYFCVQNPDCPTQYTTNSVGISLAQSFNNCSSRLPDDDKGKLSETEKTQYETEVNIDNSPPIDSPTKNRKTNYLIRDRLIDTTHYDLAYVRAKLSDKGNLESRFTIIDSWLQEANPQQAAAALTALIETPELSNPEQKELEQFRALKQIQIGALAEGTSEQAMVINHEGSIKTIADAGDFIGSNQAKRLINEYIAPTYERIVILPEVESSQLFQSPFNNNETTDYLQPTLKAIPNPAKEQTVFHYQLPEKATNGEIIITNLFGQVIERIVIAEERGSIIWTTAKVVDEIIIYSLIVDGKIIDINRLVLIK